MDFISVIIPAYNAERWLERTLKSVSDAIDAECEVIVVNDGSSDSTPDIAGAFVENDPRFTLINIDHVGPCAARRAGFLESQGDYIIFVDSDDILPHTSISEQRRLLDSSARDIRGASDVHETQHRRTDGRPKIIIANTLERKGDSKHLLISGSTRALTGAQYADEILSGELPGFLPGHFYARDVIEAIDWDDSPEITHQENYYLLLSFAMKLNEAEPDRRTVLVVPSVIGYQHVVRSGSQSALMALTPKGLERVWRHINALGLPEPALTAWGLKMLNRVFIERGIPFATNYSVAVDLRHRGEHYSDSLDKDCLKIVDALRSLKKRTAIANRLARQGGLTSIRPHLSIVIICHHNVAKIQRTVASFFAMGFRNLEVVIVDLENTHSERVALNNIAIRYARVRICRVPDDTDMYSAAVAGLNKAEGLATAYIRPGDLCRAAGLYDAVTRIDYGADAVLPNYRDYSPLTKLKGPVRTYSHLRASIDARKASFTSADASENVFDVVNDYLHRASELPQLFIYGIVWRTDFIKEHYPDRAELESARKHTVSHAFLKAMLKYPFRIVTQDRSTGAAFELFNDNFFIHWLRRLIPGSKYKNYIPNFSKE